VVGCTDTASAVAHLGAGVAQGVAAAAVLLRRVGVVAGAVALGEPRATRAGAADALLVAREALSVAEPTVALVGLCVDTLSATRVRGIALRVALALVEVADLARIAGDATVAAVLLVVGCADAVADAVSRGAPAGVVQALAFGAACAVG